MQIEMNRIKVRIVDIMLKEKIETYIRSLGLDTFGFIPCRRLDEMKEFLLDRQQKSLQNEFEEKEIEHRINPKEWMENGKTIICIAVPYNDHKTLTNNGFSVYTKRTDYHRVLHTYLDQIVSFIESLGGTAKAFVDSNCLPERYLAYLAGVGFIGRNNMIVTKKYGSYVFLGEIIMDLEIPCQESRTYEEIALYVECGECRICYKECPTKSINSNRINPNICLSYITQKKDITEKEIKLLKGNIFGCDFCQMECPYNVTSDPSNIPEFQTLDYMEEGIETYAAIDNKFFKEKISQTSCGWRGKNVLKRNALIQLSKSVKDLEQYKGSSDYINYYIELLNRLNADEIESSKE